MLPTSFCGYGNERKPVKSSSLLDPGAAPAFSGNLFASKQRARAGGLFCLAGVQLAVAAKLFFSVLGILFGINLGGVSGVAQANGSRVFFIDHRRGCLSHSVASDQRRSACSRVNNEYAAIGVCHRDLLFRLGFTN